MSSTNHLKINRMMELVRNLRSLMLVLIILQWLSSHANAAWCNMNSNVTGPTNDFDVLDAKQLNHLRSYVDPNGSGAGDLSLAGDKSNAATSGAYTYVLHLYTSASPVGGADNLGYGWGYATGKLLGKEINATLTGAWSYFRDQVAQEINGTASKYSVPADIISWIATVGLEAALDFQFDDDKAYVSSAVLNEMRGMADATGLDFLMIRRIHMIGELTRGRCSYFGMSGKATASTGSPMLQLRALDWDTDAGLQNYPVIYVYHPGAATSLGVPFINVGWAGWIGTLTGLNSKRIGVSEIGVSYPDFPPYFGNESRVGEPFVFLLRNILQFQSSLAGAVSYINSAVRTCHLLLAVGDGNTKEALAVQYSSDVVRFFDSHNLEPNAPWHPRIDDIVYEAMDWNCPFYQHTMAKQLQLYYGQLTPEIVIKNVTSAVMTGSLHSAIYDLTNDHLYVANYAPNLQEEDPSYPPLPPANERDAFSRPWFKLHTGDLFAHPRPAASANLH